MVTIKKIRREVEAYFTLNYGEIKNRKNKGTIKRNNICRKFMEEVLTPFKFVIAIPDKKSS